MIYPRNVSQAEASTGKTKTKDKVSAGIIFYTMGNVFLFAGVLLPLSQSTGISPVIMVLVQAVVSILIAVALFRHFVVDEQSKLNEHQSAQDSSLAQYYHLQKDVDTKLKVKDELTIVLGEFDDGNFTFSFKIRYGSNNDIKAQNTREAYAKIFNTLSKHGLEFRTHNLQEDFEDSKEYSEFMKSVNATKGEKLSRATLEIAEGYLQISKKNSNLCCTNVVVRTTSPYQFYDLPSIVRNILETVLSTRNAIRSVEFLEGEALNKFHREYYGLEAIDLTMLKVEKPDVALVRKYGDIIQLYQLRTKEGNSYVDSKVVTASEKSKARKI